MNVASSPAEHAGVILTLTLTLTLPLILTLTLTVTADLVSTWLSLQQTEEHAHTTQA